MSQISNLATQKPKIGNRMSICSFARWPVFVIMNVVIAAEISATSFFSLAPHEPARACTQIKASVAVMIGRKARSDQSPLFYSDEFGFVDYGEHAAFIQSMVSSRGRPDRSPIELTDVWTIEHHDTNKAKALYVIRLERDQWHDEREAFFDPMQTEPEGFDLTPSYWLVEFSENRVIAMREGFVFFNIVNDSRRLKRCGRDSNELLRPMND